MQKQVPVGSCLNSFSADTVHLTIEGETIETTPEHPFYTEEGQWVYAGSLLPGDEIRTAAWGTGTVEAIHFTPTPQTMYNLTVATAHTYFVGQGQWLVHNCNLNAFDLQFTNTIEGYVNLNNPGAITKSGQIARPYTDSRLLMQEIIDTGIPQPDSGGFATARRWEVSGSFNGSDGFWELVIDLETNTVLHFLFKSN